MRLLEIKIKNIASLKGEHLVSFRDIMAESPLFAITGETGSGKSSILNSIGLVLYGRVFKPSVQQNDVVTLGEKEGQIELLFQVRNKTYLGLWRARVRKQNGEFYSTPQSPTRDLYEVDGDKFDSPKNISLKKIEDILHLDYDQFCKCVILNQGEFARFLSSSFTERKDILEKLYPGEVLDGLSGRLRSELEVYRTEIEKIEVEMSTLRGTGVSGEELKEKKSDLQARLLVSEKNLKLLEAFDGTYRTVLHYFEDNQKNQKKLETTRADIAEVTKIQNENLLLLTQALEAFEAARKSQERELPRLQELLKMEEKEKSLSETQKTQDLKIEARRTGVTELEKNLLLSRTQEATYLEEKDLIAKGLSYPVLELRKSAKDLEMVFELTHELNLLRASHQGTKERLEKIEETGKEKSQELLQLSEKKKLLPSNVSEEIQKTQELREKQKADLEKKQRAEIGTQEITKSISQLEADRTLLAAQLKQTLDSLALVQKEIEPLRTSKQLSTLLNAVLLCRQHESTLKSEECPVCETKLSGARWQELRAAISSQDLRLQLERLEVLERELIRLSEEQKTIEKNHKLIEATVVQKTNELKVLAPLLNLNTESPEVLESKLTSLNQQKWELDRISSEEKKIQEILLKAREDFSRVRLELQTKTAALEAKEQELHRLTRTLGLFIPGEITAELITDLKRTLGLFKGYLDKESLFERAQQTRQHQEESLSKATAEFESLLKENLETRTLRETLSKELALALNGERASVRIQTLSHQVKSLEEDHKKRDAHYRKLDQSFKEASGRLIQLNELLKEIELQFIRARDELRGLAKSTPLTEDAALDRLVNTLRTLDLDFSSPADLFVPVKELILAEKEKSQLKVSSEREDLAATLARLNDWEKRQDKITILEIRYKELKEKSARRERLYDVLGKDELRTFVLALVEENLIQQTNDELQKLCQGRYEIVHQSRKMKLTPEFYVLDRFREGGLRKVATLSGGETFMVSLAMAIALAEMTRGQAEIDSLFIDEGFGTLDHDSLEDVLDMLNQIQTRGLMVGIISHIKPLTNALPVNLLLSKRQDGTSTLSLQYN